MVPDHSIFTGFRLKLSPFLTRLALNLFPPILFNRIRITHLSRDFKYCRVRIRKSVLNTNFQGSVFGGTLFSGGDPFQAILYWQYFEHEGIHLQAWLKKARIDYLKPARTHLILEFHLSDDDIHEARTALAETGRFEKWHDCPVRTVQGDQVALMKTLVHLKKI